MKNNTIYNTILKNRNGHYVHALEVASSYEIEIAIGSIWGEFNEVATIDELKEFFNTMQIYYYETNEYGEQIEIQANEDDVYNFDINEFINTI
jgi:hypothetical protein